MRKKLFSIVALLLVAVVGAMAQETYKVTVKEGTEGAEKWTIDPNPAAAGEAVTVTYAGTKKVKSVKAVKKAAADLGHVLADAVVGEIVGSDGKAYAVADKDNLPTDVTAVAMVAYKDGSNGLAIALADEASTMNWSTAISPCEGKTAIGSYSWKLPSNGEWGQMFEANGGNYTGLNTAITTAGGTALEVYNTHWRPPAPPCEGGEWILLVEKKTRPNLVLSSFIRIFARRKPRKRVRKWLKLIKTLGLCACTTFL